MASPLSAEEASADALAPAAPAKEDEIIVVADHDASSPSSALNADTPDVAEDGATKAEHPGRVTKAQTPRMSNLEMNGLPPEMRKLLRRAGMAGAASQTSARVREVNPEVAARRALRRKVLEFWSKGAHGYSPMILGYCRNLNLTGCCLVDDDGEALSSELSRNMRNLKIIDLSDNKFGDRTLVALSVALARGAAPMVTDLQLGHNAVGDVGLKAFSAALVAFDGFDNLKGELFRQDETTITRALPRLGRLVLAHNAIGAKGIGYLAAAASEGRALQSLTYLALSGNAIGDDGFGAIAEAAEDDEVLPKLCELHLCDTGVTEKGITALSEVMQPSKAGGLPGLRTLLVDERHIQTKKLQDVYHSRTGQGGVHHLQIYEVPVSARSPRVQQSPRFQR